MCVFVCVCVCLSVCVCVCVCVFCVCVCSKNGANIYICSVHDKGVLILEDDMVELRSQATPIRLTNLRINHHCIQHFIELPNIS